MGTTSEICNSNLLFETPHLESRSKPNIAQVSEFYKKYLTMHLIHVGIQANVGKMKNICMSLKVKENR